MLRQHKRYLE
uniref:Uncharacterized protein n=1 Tax=Lepeophtheirus salmonis TaxID=72036 RepID=A0A0K2UYY7_LEPSM